MSNATQAAPALPLMDETYYRSRRRRQGLREDLNSFWFLLPILALFVILCSWCPWCRPPIIRSPTSTAIAPT